MQDGTGPISGFEVFEHTADVGIRVWGATWADLLTQAGRAMFSLIVDPNTILPLHRRVIEVTGADREELLMNWLKELLSRFDIDGELLSEFQIRSADATHVAAEVAGEPLDRDRHDPDMEVKAVTWHQFCVRQTSNGAWEATVIFDI